MTIQKVEYKLADSEQQNTLSQKDRELALNWCCMGLAVGRSTQKWICLVIIYISTSISCGNKREFQPKERVTEQCLTSLSIINKVHACRLLKYKHGAGCGAQPHHQSKFINLEVLFNLQFNKRSNGKISQIIWERVL